MTEQKRPPSPRPVSRTVRLKRLEEAKDLLVRAGEELATSLDITATFDILSRLVVPQFADWYTVHLVVDDGVPKPVHIAHQNSELTRQAWEAVERWATRGGDLAVLHVIRTGESIRIPEISAEMLDQAARDGEHREALRLARLSSAMLVPLRLVDGTIIGSMIFIAAESKRCYQADDLTLAEALANRAAAAISNARLHEQTREAGRRAEQAVQRLDLLMNASAAIAQDSELDQALKRLAEFAVTALADYCITYRIDPAGRIHRIGLAHADPNQLPHVEALDRAGAPQPDDRFGVGQVVREGRSLLVPEIPPEALDRMPGDAHRAALLALAPRSTIVVPLIARGRTVGALTFATTDHSGRRYGTDDLALAEELAARIALQIDNARLYTEARRADRAKEDMLAIVSHDLRSPLNTVTTACELLDLPLTEKQRGEIHGSIRRAARQMQRLVDDLLDTTRIEQGQLTIDRAPTDLAVLVQDVVKMHAPVAQSRSIALIADVAHAGVLLHADLARLAQALGNLIDNALRVTPAGGEVRIELRQDDGSISVSVQDSGPGVSEEDLPYLFDRFWRSSTSVGRGAGLGLAIAKGIVVAHGGTIEVDSRPGAGACFTVTFPAGAMATEN